MKPMKNVGGLMMCVCMHIREVGIWGTEETMDSGKALPAGHLFYPPASV